MCGISGIFSHRQRVNSVTLDRFNRALSHRGPDHQATYTSPCGRVGLGHCRLSIVDVSEQANQPFYSEDKRHWLVFNGEIYNFVELREELKANGYSFRTQSDTEVLLTAYLAWGMSCLNRFNGMWALAIWDDEKKSLFVARDRFGVKPLYYAAGSEQFSFASEQRAFRHINKSFAFIDAKIASAAIFNPPSVEAQEKTIYSGISRLLPGHCLVVSDGEVEQHKWWDTLSEIGKSEKSKSHAELLTLFEDACLIRARTDVDIAFSLSGGLDSSAVTSFMAARKELAGKQLKAFTGGFLDDPLDESHYAQMVTKQVNIRHKIVDVDTWLTPELMTGIVQCTEDISFFPAVGQYAVYQSMLRSGYKVSLEGHGGDELFGGYPSHVNAYMGDLIRQRSSALELARTINMLASQRQNFGNKAVDLKGSILQADRGFTGVKNRASHLRQFVPEPSLEQTHLNRLLESETFLSFSLLEQKLYLDFHFLTLPHILRNYDRLSMKNSVEVRSPFLDYRLVVAALTSSADNKIAHGLSKRILREHFTFIPEPIRRRTDKSGFTVPLAKWLSGKLKDWLLDLVNSREFRQTSLFDGNKVSEIILCHGANSEYQQIVRYWPLLSLHLLSSQGA